MKKDNIKQYYINKNIEKHKLLSKLQGSIIRQSRDNTLQFKLWENLISRINKAYKFKNIIRIISYKQLIGCNEIELYNHLESILPICFKMSDYPKWEVDHIKAISNYDLNNVEQQLECFNYTNLQPLLKILNQQKFNK